MAFSAITVISFAQTIETCNGDKTKRTDLLTKTAVFQQIGINLNKYDWKTPDVNCHINETISNLGKRNLYNYLGGGGIGGGISFIALGATQSSYSGLTGNSGAGSYILGAALVGGGIYALIQASKKKKKHNYHLNQVSEHYRQKGWF